MEVLSHDVVLIHDVLEFILERVPAKNLLRFKQVSKQWRSTIESKNFQQRQLRHRQQSRDQDVLFLTSSCNYDDYTKKIPSSSSSVTRFKFPMKDRFVCSTSCDGLVCLFNQNEPSIVINPTTRWHRTIPLSNSQGRGRFPSDEDEFPFLGFGKDKVNGTYKLVILYNLPSFHDYYRVYRPTRCEVFEFSTNTWRYVTTPACASEIISELAPVYVEGSLHWFTDCGEPKPKVLSFDLHTETFQVIATAPFTYRYRYYMSILMCNLNNRLCVSKNKKFKQLIWLFDSDSKAWNKVFSIDLTRTCLLHKMDGAFRGDFLIVQPLFPVAVLEGKNKLLLRERDSSRALWIYDVRQTKPTGSVFKSKSIGYPLNYFQSLISI